MGHHLTETQLLSEHLADRLGAVGARRLMSLGIAITVAAVAVQAASQAIDFGLLGLHARIIDSNHHASVFGGVSVLAQMAAALCVGARGIWSRTRWQWLLLSALIAVLLVIRGLLHFNAAMLMAPVSGIFVLAVWLSWQDDLRIRATVWAALLLLASSFMLHLVGLDADSTTGRLDKNWPYQLTGMLKHGTELGGWLLLATAAAASSALLLSSRARGGRTQRRPADEPDRGPQGKPSLLAYGRPARFIDRRRDGRNSGQLELGGRPRGASGGATHRSADRLAGEPATRDEPQDRAEAPRRRSPDDVQSGH